VYAVNTSRPNVSIGENPATASLHLNGVRVLAISGNLRFQSTNTIASQGSSRTLSTGLSEAASYRFFQTLAGTVEASE
jgi:hypothetical protein